MNRASYVAGILVTGLLGFGLQTLSAQPTLTWPPGSLSPSTVPSLNVVAFPGTPDWLFSVTFAGVPAGESITNRAYQAWCVDVRGDFNPASYAFALYQTLPAASLPIDGQNANWDKVNWVLNNKPAARTMAPG